jgi:glucose-1-phosphate cytidylyltransferase
VPLNHQIECFLHEDKVVSFLCVKPNLSCHFISLNPGGVVETIKDVTRSDIRINGGYFVFRKDIFQYMKNGEELLHEPFQRLVEQKQLLAYKYDGFWAAMDTFKDKQMLEDIHERGRAPWQVWNYSPQKRPALPRLNKPTTRLVTSHLAVRR